MTIVEMGLTMLAHAYMPLKFWYKDFLTVIFTLNTLPILSRQFKTPFEVLHGKQLNYNFLKIFRCACYPYLRDYNNHKFDFHTSKFIFLRYNTLHKGYKYFHSNGRVSIFRHVIFYERDFPYTSLFANLYLSLAVKILLTCYLSYIHEHIDHKIHL